MHNVYDKIENIKLFEISFTDNKGVLQQLVCSVKFIEKESIILIANNQQNKYVFAKAGNEINVYIYTELGVFTAVSKIIQSFEGVINTEYIITYPEESKHFQRREYFRVEMAIDTNITIITESPELNDLIIYSKTKNISGKGMSYVSKSHIPDFSEIVVELFFPEKVITTLATPIYYRKIKHYYQPKLVHGFNFINISQRDTDFIVKQCFLRQLELRKKHSV